MKIFGKQKAIVLSIVLVAGMLLPVGASAQDYTQYDYTPRVGLFHNYGLFYSEEEEVRSLFRYNEGYGNFNIFPEQFDQSGNGGGGLNISTQQFDPNNNEAPLGSGLFILAVTGAGYALKKRKSTNKTVSR